MTKSVEFDYFLKGDFSEHTGKWVAICNRKVISSSRSIIKTMKDAKKICNNKKPLYAKIPSKNQTMIL